MMKLTREAGCVIQVASSLARGQAPAAALQKVCAAVAEAYLAVLHWA